MARGLSRKDRADVAVWRIVVDAVVRAKAQADAATWGGFDGIPARVGDPKPGDLGALCASEALEALDRAGYRVTRKPASGGAK